MMKIFRLLIMASLGYLMIGCASMTGTIQGNQPVDKSKGVLLAGLTADDKGYVNDAWYYYRKKGSKEELRLDALGTNLFGKPDDYPEDKSKDGRLVAIPLDAGEYELFSWTLYINQAGGYGYIKPKNSPPPLSFSISPGKITYLGNLHLNTFTGKNLFGISIPAGAEPDIRDNQSVDMPLLKVKYPNLNDWPVQVSVPDASAWKMLK